MPTKAHVTKKLADFHSLGDPTVVTRTPLLHINYIVDVAVNMPGEVNRTPQQLWFACIRSTYLPQPVVLCLRSLPADTQQPALVSVVSTRWRPVRSTSHAGWKFKCPLSLPAPFVEWFQSRLRFEALLDGRMRPNCGCWLSLTSALRCPTVRPGARWPTGHPALCHRCRWWPCAIMLWLQAAAQHHSSVGVPPDSS